MHNALLATINIKHFQAKFLCIMAQFFHHNFGQFILNMHLVFGRYSMVYRDISAIRTTDLDSKTVQSRNHSRGSNRHRTYSALIPTRIPAGTIAATRKSLPIVLEMSPTMASAVRCYFLRVDESGTRGARFLGFGGGVGIGTESPSGPPPPKRLIKVSSINRTFSLLTFTSEARRSTSSAPVWGVFAMLPRGRILQDIADARS